ncbi:MAG: tRNA pseudouridine(38-40) synthase TruA [Desulfosarcinaceae bacterium]|nr:tRNA pseudouridine(38-40) synthase TruA [Desulfosarcinaceae bacterium]
MGMQNFKLMIEYDGGDFHGWQRQAGQRSVQESIEVALTRMTRQKITLIGSGRTDAGVHARGQVANFACRTRLTADAVQRGLNSMLGGAIVIRRCETAAEGFHSRYDATCKTYRYTIRNHPLPRAIGRHYHWHVRAPLDLAPMQTASRYLLGRHDFSAFEGAGSPRQHSVRTLVRAEWRRSREHYLEFFIAADGFLRFMVRNIVGTLVEVGRGKRPPEDIPTLLAMRDRSKAGPTAPPQGLCLLEVAYG